MASGYVLGISAFYHDSAACLLAGDVIVAAAQEERFTRVKGDERFPAHAARYCLAEAGVTAFCGRPSWASMTLPPPASPEPLIDDRGTRRRAPVSDHPAVSPARRVTSLPSEGEVLSLNVVGALFFVGIDWAAAVHAVCVLDATGRRVAAFTIEHSAAGLADLMRRLARLGDPDQMPVAIERRGTGAGFQVCVCMV